MPIFCTRGVLGREYAAQRRRTPHLIQSPYRAGGLVMLQSNEQCPRPASVIDDVSFRVLTVTVKLFYPVLIALIKSLLDINRDAGLSLPSTNQEVRVLNRPHILQNSTNALYVTVSVLMGTVDVCFTSCLAIRARKKTSSRARSKLFTYPDVETRRQHECYRRCLGDTGARFLLSPKSRLLSKYFGQLHLALSHVSLLGSTRSRRRVVYAQAGKQYTAGKPG